MLANPLILFGLIFGLVIFFATLINIKVCIFLMIFSIAISPEISIGGVPIRFEDLLMIILGISWLGRLAIKREGFPYTSLTIPIFIYLFVCLISTLLPYLFTVSASMRQTGLESPNMFHYLKKIQIFLMFYIITSNIKSKNDIRQIFVYVLIASIFLAAFGVKQSLSGTKIMGPLGEGANTIGMYFALVATVCLGVLFSRVSSLSGIDRLFLIIATLAYIYTIIFTLSRVSYVALSIAIILLGIFKDKRLLLLFIILLVFVAMLSPSRVIERITSIRGIFVETEKPFYSWEARKSSWKYHLPIVLSKSPIFGFGLGSIALAALESEYLVDLYYTGILGTLIFIWLYFSLFKVTLWVARNSDDLIQDIAISFLAISVGYFVGCISGPIFTAIRTTSVFWMFAALIVGAQKLLLENSETELTEKIDST